MRKIILLLLLVCSAPLFALGGGKKGQFWLHAGAETAFYGQGSGAAFGGGLSAGYSIRSGAFSAKAAWFAGIDGGSVLELTLMARFWLGLDPFSGGFVQFQAGTIFFAPNAADVFNANGEHALTVGFLCGGYRFLLGNRFYIEPAARVGYPYLVGASFSAGVHFREMRVENGELRKERYGES